MRIRRIDVEGDARGRRAELTRDGANIRAIISEGGEMLGNAHIVGHTQEENLFELARTVQHAIDGYTGTGSEIHDYYRLIQRLAD